MTPDTLNHSTLTQILKRGMDALTEDRFAEAGKHALQAVRLSPLSEEAWLLLAAAAAPQERTPLLKHLLQIHPESESARQALTELESKPSNDPAAGAGSSLPPLKEILAQISADKASAAATASAAEDPTNQPEKKHKPAEKNVSTKPTPSKNNRKGMNYQK